MSFYNAELHCMMPSGPHVTGVAATPAAQQHGDGESFFHHILDVINPLQHLPIVGTIYRAITGEHIGPIEKIAGDGLYGGILGAATSAADVAFEAITGKSVEDTVLAWIKGDSNTAVASAKVQAPRIAFNTSLPSANIPILPTDTAVASVQGDNSTALMAWLKGDSNTAVASAKVQAPKIAFNTSLPSADMPILPAETAMASIQGNNSAALLASMNAQGLSGDMAMRAMAAYRRSMAQPVVASAN